MVLRDTRGLAAPAAFVHRTIYSVPETPSLWTKKSPRSSLNRLDYAGFKPLGAPSVYDGPTRWALRLQGLIPLFAASTNPFITCHHLLNLTAMPQPVSKSWQGFLYCLLVLHAFAHSAYSARVVTSSTNASTCPSRTVNYITYTLPQQCLKSSWSSTAITSPSVTETSAASQISQNPTDSHASKISASVRTTLANVERHVEDYSAAVSSTSPTATPSSGPTSDADTSFESLQASPVISSPSPPDADSDAESPLGNADFLSFEQWKRQNLARSGQSADLVGTKRRDQEGEPRRRPGNINNALDAIGDDAEIDLSFGGFAAETPTESEPTSWGRQVERGDDTGSAGQSEEGHSPRRQSRSKDAGTTCKERFNYASFDCAATVLKTNPQCSGSSSVLVENKDSYMLNECSANNKFLILELCDDIAIDTIVLANFEFFSSIFRTFRVSVSDRYPVKLDKWMILGTYEARHSREVQAFLVENPLIWARYLRIEFLSHYGNEFYCPLSLVRVHGTTMMEDYKHDGESSKSDDDTEEDDVEAVKNGERLASEAVADVVIQERLDHARAEDLEKNAEVQTLPHITTSSKASESSVQLSPFDKVADESTSARALFNIAQPMCERDHVASSTQRSQLTPSSAILLGATASPKSTSIVDPPMMSTTKPPSVGFQASGTLSGVRCAEPSPATIPDSTITQSSSSGSQDLDSNTSMPSITRPNPSRDEGMNSTATHTTRSSSSITQPAPANPTIQESFFKSVQKRLTQLESNSSLSLQYIEEQSRLLRSAFSTVEKRQLAKTTSFLESLNTTVLSELRQFRQQYDQIWQSTVIELESQREQYQREVLAMNARLGVVAQEVVFQKRVSIIQTVLVLLCLGLVLFSRGAMNSYLDLPIVQNVITRSQSFRSPSPTLETPSVSPISTRPSSAYAERRHFGILKSSRRQDSDNLGYGDEGLDGPTISHSPPTPISDNRYDAEEMNESDEQIDVDRARCESPTPESGSRPRSSPPELPSALTEHKVL